VLNRKNAGGSSFGLLKYRAKGIAIGKTGEHANGFQCEFVALAFPDEFFGVFNPPSVPVFGKRLFFHFPEIIGQMMYRNIDVNRQLIDIEFRLKKRLVFLHIRVHAQTDGAEIVAFKVIQGLFGFSALCSIGVPYFVVYCVRIPGQAVQNGRKQEGGDH
jgi:hypothetical protein